MSWSRILMLCWEIALCISAIKGGLPTLWPAGLYGLPQAKSGCPDTSMYFSWSTGTLHQALGPHSSILPADSHLKAKVTNQGVERSFCFKNSTSMDSMRPVWPSGSYCIYMNSNNCPLGLKKGYLMWTQAFGQGNNYQTGDVPKGHYNTTSTKIYYCCRTSGYSSTPIVLPITSPFLLLTSSKNHLCQNVRQTIHRRESIGYDVNETSLFTTATPHPYYTKGNNVMSINYCYYQACQWTYNGLSGTITSPFYPNNYKNHLDCQWTIQVPKNYHITLYFHVFVLESSLSCNLACTCDKLEVTFKSEGYSSAVTHKYCEKLIHYPPNKLSTYSNMVVLNFHSDGNIIAQGFKISYASFRVAEDTTTTTAAPTTSVNVTTTLSTNNTSKATTTATTIASTTASTSSFMSSTPKESSTTGSFSEQYVHLSTGHVAAVTRKDKREGSSYLKALAIAVSACVVFLALCGVGFLVYCRRNKGKTTPHSWLNIRYSRDSTKMRTSTLSTSTIDMYGGDDVEIIPEQKESDNPIYSSANVYIKCNDLQKKYREETSENTLYASPYDLKSNNPIYDNMQSDNISDDRKTENPLYDRIL